MTVSSQDILRRIVEEIGEESRLIAKRVIQPHSRLLAREVYFRRKRGAPDTVRGALTIDFYWAVYLHDGRKAQSRSDGYYVFWRRPSRAKDPRLQGGFHRARTEAEEKRLTRAQFRQGLKANKRAKEAGREPPMIVTQFTSATPPTLFFSEGMDIMQPYADDIVASVIDDVSREIAEDLSASFTTVIT